MRNAGVVACVHVEVDPPHDANRAAEKAGLVDRFANDA